MINKIHISLLEFIRTGKFANIEIGQTMEYIQNNFPPPDNISDMGYDTFIWQYGVFEFHFIAGALTLLWCDNLNYLNNPDKKQYILDKWILSESNKLSFSYFCSRLDQENIKYHLNGTFFESENQKLPDNIILSVDNTDTVIYFEDTDQNAVSLSEYNLIAIGASQFELKYKVYPL